jgi:hypothetical protein
VDVDVLEVLEVGILELLLGVEELVEISVEVAVEEV